MGCFAFRSGGKSGSSSSTSSRPQQHPRPGARTPPAKSAPASTSSSSSSSGAGAGAQSNTKAAAASAPAAASSATPTRTIQELSEERGAQRLRVFDLDELGSATNGFSRALKLGEGGFGSVYRAFFRSAAGARVVLAVKRLNQRSLQVRLLPAISSLSLSAILHYLCLDFSCHAKVCFVFPFLRIHRGS
jgi:hypothetical protein